MAAAGKGVAQPVMKAGNLTQEVAVDIGMDEAIIIESDGTRPIVHVRTDLAPDSPEARTLAIEDNRSAELSLSWDASQIAQELEAGLDLSGMFYPEELSAILEQAADALLGTDKEPPEAQVDRAAELQEKWHTERGQIWTMGQHRLMCGDSRDSQDVAQLLEDVQIDALVFDPPYDAGLDVIGLRWPCQDALVFTDHRHLLDAVDGWPQFRCAFAWDGVTSWYTPGWPLARAKLCLWFGDSKYNPDGAHYGEPDVEHVVKNTRGEYLYKPDPRGKHLSTLYQEQNTQQFEGHVHSKPVAWMRMLLANCTGGAIFDPFVGGGTSFVVAEGLKRQCLGVEIEALAVAVTLERIAGIGLEPKLLEATH
jgi:DNA modification methylase